MDIDISTIRTELEQRLARARGEHHDVLQTTADDNEYDIVEYGDDAYAQAIGFTEGEIHQLNSLLLWLREIEQNG